MIDIVGTEINLSGDLDRHTVTGLFDNFPQLSEPTYHVNLQQVERIDSAGLALLVYWYSKTAEEFSTSRIVFTHIPKKLMVMAELGGLDSIFQA